MPPLRHLKIPVPKAWRWTATLRAIAVMGGCSVLIGCATPSEMFERRARQAGLERIEIRSTRFLHLVYRAAATSVPRESRVLFVYLEGDGRPGAGRGFKPSADPTPRNPLALALMLRTATEGDERIYLTRPCYNGLARRPECEASLWTSARYSPKVVLSLVEALQRYVQDRAVNEVVLIGYSGGGTLAMLMGPHLPQLKGIITVAANLDIDAWTRMHGYLPLSGSLNPLNLPEAAVPVVHLVGVRDRNVPPEILADYLQRHPQAAVWHYETFDHQCCWVREWPRLLERARQFIEAHATLKRMH